MFQPKLKVGILGATGMVGQRFLSLLANHPWFEVVILAAGPNSAGKTYAEALGTRWCMAVPIPDQFKTMSVVNVSDFDAVVAKVDFVFCAVDMPKDEIKKLEEAYAKREIPVVSNNSANRMVADIPMIVPELNPEHAKIIEIQRKRLGTKVGFITVKPNCSIQSYVPVLHPLKDFGLKTISVCTYQAISGAGKTFSTWPEMVDNVIPLIKGEEEKSEQEPLKIWGKITNKGIELAKEPLISAQCIRVAASDGHMAAFSVKFKKKPSKEEIIARWKAYEGLPQKYDLPSAPHPFLQYCEEEGRPQTRLDRDFEKGMAVSIGRLRDDPLFDYKIVALSHNTLRGAAGGAVLTAEYLVHEGYITKRN